MRQIFPYLAELPATVNGAAVADENGDYTIYINAALSEGARYEAFCHEVRHILLGHHEGEAAPGAEARADAPILTAEVEKSIRSGLLPALPVVEYRTLIPSPSGEVSPLVSAADAMQEPLSPSPGESLLDSILADLVLLEEELAGCE